MEKYINSSNIIRSFSKPTKPYQRKWKRNWVLVDRTYILKFENKS